MELKEWFEKLADEIDLEKVMMNIISDDEKYGGLTYPGDCDFLYHCSICNQYFPNLEEHCKNMKDNEHLIMEVHES